MTSKEEILKRIRGIELKEHPLPLIPDFVSENYTLEVFQKQLNKNGARLVEGGLQGYIENNICSGLRILSCYSAFSGNVTISELTKPLQEPQRPHDLEGIEIAVLPAELGVAENGALWISESILPFRVLPFIVHHLIVVLETQSLVATMHEAYKKVSLRETGFGCFVSGPSKTADIEQSLVIGAHGSLSFHVLLV